MSVVQVNIKMGHAWGIIQSGDGVRAVSGEALEWYILYIDDTRVNVLRDKRTDRLRNQSGTDEIQSEGKNNRNESCEKACREASE